MSDKVYVGQKIITHSESPSYQPYSRVNVIVNESDGGEQEIYTAGDDSGLTLEVEIPWGTQEIANNILNSINGYAYKPFRSSGSLVDPAAELGDAITVKDTYSVLASQDINFNSLMNSDISAPTSSELEHEYPYETADSRELRRRIANTNTRLIVENGRITAEITRATNAEVTLSSKITQTAESIETKITEITQDNGIIESKISRIALTPDNITMQVSSDSGGNTILLLDNGSIKANSPSVSFNGRVVFVNDLSSTGTTTVDGSRITLSGTNGISNIINSSLDGLDITVTNSYNSDPRQSRIQLKRGSTEIDSATIILSGEVVIGSDLSTDGKTIINGANIKTGDILASNIETGCFTKIETSTGKLTWKMANSLLDDFGNFICGNIDDDPDSDRCKMILGDGTITGYYAGSGQTSKIRMVDRLSNMSYGNTMFLESDQIALNTTKLYIRTDMDYSDFDNPVFEDDWYTSGFDNGYLIANTIKNDMVRMSNFSITCHYDENQYQTVYLNINGVLTSVDLPLPIVNSEFGSYNIQFDYNLRRVVNGIVI